MNDNGNPQESDDEDSHHQRNVPRQGRAVLTEWPEIAPRLNDSELNSELSAIVKSRTECNCGDFVL